MRKGGSYLGERERRSKMSDYYSSLHSVIPNLPIKASREQIVTGTINCIQSLKEDIRRLENLKNSLSPPSPALSHCSSCIEVTVSGDGVVFFGVRLVFRRHLATDVFRVFEKHGAEVLAASVSMNQSNDDDEKVLVVAVTALVSGGKDAVEMIRKEIIGL